jgi:hypothetical protein
MNKKKYKGKKSHDSIPGQVFRKLISGILGQPWFDHQPRKSSMVDHGLTMQPYGSD